MATSPADIYIGKLRKKNKNINEEAAKLTKPSYLLSPLTIAYCFFIAANSKHGNKVTTTGCQAGCFIMLALIIFRASEVLSANLTLSAATSKNKQPARKKNHRSYWLKRKTEELKQMGQHTNHTLRPPLIIKKNL